MALTERTVDDKIEIVGDYKHIQVRTATIIERDGVEVSRIFHRRVICPLDDVSSESDEIRALVSAIHTPEVTSAYKAHMNANDVPSTQDMPPLG